MKRIFIAAALFLSGCATAVPSASTMAYIASDNIPTYRKPTANSPTTSNVFYRNEIVFVTEHKDPDWVAFHSSGGQKFYTKSSFISSYRTQGDNSATNGSTTPSPSSNYHNIQTGPRGGHYYINSNGNKTYTKHK